MGAGLICLVETKIKSSKLNEVTDKMFGGGDPMPIVNSTIMVEFS